MRTLAFPTSGLQTALLLTASLQAGNVLACTSINASDTTSSAHRIHNNTQPDSPLTTWVRGNTGAGFTGCANNQAQRFTFRPNIQGLTFVRNITVDGKTYPAYAWGPSSPMIIIRLRTTPLATEPYSTFPVDIGRPTQGTTSPTLSGVVSAYLEYRLISRGGAMTSVPPVTLQGTTSLDRFAGLGTVNHSTTLSADVAQLTCTLSDTSVALDDARGSDLPSVGATAKVRSFDVSINCPAYGPTVELVLEDANAPGSTGSELTPTGDSSTEGIRIQLLRSGQPVQFGQPWIQPLPVTGGRQSISLQARYLRTDVRMSPGEIKGIATLTATYQ